MERKSTIRFYPNLVESVVGALERIFQKGELADVVVAEILKSNKKWGSRDRRFIAENTYDIVRWYRLLYETLGKKPQKTSDWWEIFGILQVINGVALPEWKAFENLDIEAIEKQFAAVKETRKIRESIPDWLDELAAKEMGEDSWTVEMKALNESAPLVLRANTLKNSAKTLQAILAKEGIESKLIEGDALVLPKRRKLQNTSVFRKGLFEIQDYGSQQISLFLEVEKGMKVIDACAGAGGKSLHLAALMENEGKILALDIHVKKLRELEKRARRNGAEIIKNKKISSPKTIEKYHETADRLLIDAPCSGLGVLKRKPDSKWKLKPEDIERVKILQADLLKRYSQMLKIDGKMVYATCSVLPAENEEQVATFLAENENFVLEKEKNIRPSEGFDGYYMALLKRIS